MQFMNTAKEEAGRRRLRCHGPLKNKVPTLLLTAVMLLVSAMVGQAAPSARSNRAPYLDLSGTIVDINRATGYVYVNVNGEHCPGRRAFRADNIEKLQSYVGVPIFFIIDSESCVGTGMETILVSRGIRK